MAHARVPTIISCDPGCDDVLGLLLALSSPAIDIIAIQPQFGNTDMQAGYTNVLKMYGVLDKHCKAFPEHKKRFPALYGSKPVLLAGAVGPMEGGLHTAKYFHGADEPASGATLLSILAAQTDNSVNYIALGPLTDLALALKENDALVKQKLKRVTIMGGALDVPGNTSPTAEFNFYADASAAHYVFGHSSTLPMYLLPLDITTPHTLPWSLYASLVDSNFPSRPDAAADHPNPLAQFTSAFLAHTCEVMKKYGKDAMELHDPLAIWFAIENADADEGNLRPGWETEKREFAVERRGEYTTGMLVIDRRASTNATEEARREKGKSRAVLQQEKDAEAARKQERADPAPVQVDDPHETELHMDEGEEIKGVNVVIRTPGYELLAMEMMKKIWGVGQ